MLCLACGADMRLVQVVKDTTMLVSGYEHHTWQCSGCSTTERRMTFTREKTATQPLPVERNQMAPVKSAQAVSVEPTQTASAEATHLRPLTTTLQTNVWFEKLRSLKERASAAREAARSR
jgi:hypothetical protein